MATTLFAQAYAPYLALGVGDLGGRAAAAGCLDGFGEKLLWAACDTQSSRLLATGLERKVRLEVPRALRPDFVAAALKRHDPQFQRLVRKKELLVLFGSIEEPILLPLCAALGQQLGTGGRGVCAIGLEPLLAEESPAVAAPAGVDLFMRLSAARRAARLGPDASAARMARLGEETLSVAVEALLGALVGCDSAPGFTFDELREFLRGGAIRSLVGAAHGPAGVLSAFEEALNDSLPDPGFGTALALSAGREFSVNEVRSIRARLAEVRGAAAPVLLGFGTDPALGEEARCLLMCRPVSSRNVIPLSRCPV